MLDTYTEATSGDYDSLKPSDVVQHLLVVQPLSIRTGVTSTYRPGETFDAIISNVADLNDATGKTVYRSVMWSNGAIVDNLRENIGKTVAVKMVYATSKNGREFIKPEAATGDDIERAKTWLSANPTAFAPEVSTVNTATGEISGNTFTQQLVTGTPAPAVPAQETPAPVAPAAIDPAAAAAAIANLTPEQLKALGLG